MNKIFFFAFLFCTVTALGASRLKPLTPKDLSVLNSGASCWLETKKKANQYFFDDMSNAVAKVSKKVIKFERKAGDWDSGFFNCGQTYEYISIDKKVHAIVKMNKGKGENCTGSVQILGVGQPVKMSSLKSNCGE